MAAPAVRRIYSATAGSLAFSSSELRPVKPIDIVPSLRPLLSSSIEARRKIGFRGDSKSFKIGILVGGGPSSMALAFLLKNLPADAFPLPIDVHAIIVDIDTVLNTEKQHIVSQWLSNIDVSSENLTYMQNTGKTMPEDQFTAAFSMVRHMKAMVDSKIILTGLNHDDHDDETIMKLLQPPKDVVWTSLYPIGHIHRIAPGNLSLNSYDNYGGDMRVGSSILRTGHVQIPGSHGKFLGRPLKRYPEHRLIDTCKYYGIPFLDNYARSERLLPSVRDTVRNLQHNHHLPQALRKRFLTSLRDRAINSAVILRDLGREKLETFRIHSWNLRSGVLEIELPNVQCKLPSSEKIAYCWALRTLQNAVQPYERTIVEPENEFELFSAKGMKYLFPGIEDDGPKSTNTKKSSFNEGFLRFTRTKRKPYASYGSIVWRITREPPEPSEVRLRPFALLGWVKSAHLEALGAGKTPASSQIERNYSNVSPLSDYWAVSKVNSFDSRWWLKIFVRPEHMLKDIRIRFVQESDLPHIRKALHAEPKHAQESFLAMLDKVVPGPLIFTIPILLWKDKVVGFPTLGFALWNHLQQPLEIKWLVEYKTYKIARELLKYCRLHPDFPRDHDYAWFGQEKSDVDIQDGPTIKQPNYETNLQLTL